MNPLQLIGILSNFAVFIPPPWGPLVAAIAKVAPLVTEGVAVLQAVNKADPTLMPHLRQAASEVGVNIEVAAKVFFAPHTLTASESSKAGISPGPHYHGGPKG